MHKLEGVKVKIMFLFEWTHEGPLNCFIYQTKSSVCILSSKPQWNEIYIKVWVAKRLMRFKEHYDGVKLDNSLVP